MKTIRDRDAYAPGTARHRDHRAIPDPPIGAKFGGWTVTGETVHVGRSRRVPCRCECGNTGNVRIDNLARCPGGCRACSGWARRAKLSAGGRRSLMDRKTKPTAKRARPKPYPGAMAPDDDRK